MSAFTLRFQPNPPETVVEALDARARRDGFRIAWQHSRELARSYALVEDAGRAAVASIAGDAAVLDSPIIALALRPNPPEALPALQSALAGRGGPAGIRRCERAGDALVLEWDLDATPASVVLGIVDVELERTHGWCRNELLTPLPLAWWTRIAAEGLGAPEIAPDRVLEALIEAHDVAS